MLAHLFDEQRPTCEPVSLDPTLAAPPTGDQEAFAEAAYEAALQLDAERCGSPHAAGDPRSANARQ